METHKRTYLSNMWSSQVWNGKHRQMRWNPMTDETELIQTRADSHTGKWQEPRGNSRVNNKREKSSKDPSDGNNSWIIDASPAELHLCSSTLHKDTLSCEGPVLETSLVCRLDLRVHLYSIISVDVRQNSLFWVLHFLRHKVQIKPAKKRFVWSLTEEGLHQIRTFITN